MATNNEPRRINVVDYSKENGRCMRGVSIPKEEMG